MEKETNIIELKDRPCVITYLGFLQNTITRMAGNSSNIKALIAVVYTIFITIIIAVKKFERYWWFGFIIAFIGIIMDSYYLAFERMYRKKYNDFNKELNCGKINENDIYNMNPKITYLKYEVFAVMLECINSFSVIGYYILFLLITILIKFI